MAGIDAFGTVWEIELTPTFFTAVADVTSIDLLDVDVDTIDVSSHDSTAQWREFIAGMKDAGELSMDINYDPALHAAIFTEVGGNPKAHRFTLTDAGAATVACDALVTGFKAQAPFDDKLSATVTIKVTGPVTITP